MKDFKINVSYDKKGKVIKVSDGDNFYGLRNATNGLSAYSIINTFLYEYDYFEEGDDSYDPDKGIELEDGEY